MGTLPNSPQSYDARSALCILGFPNFGYHVTRPCGRISEAPKQANRAYRAYRGVMNPRPSQILKFPALRDPGFFLWPKLYEFEAAVSK